MPTSQRTTRSLLALLLVATLVGITTASATMARQESAPAVLPTLDGTGEVRPAISSAARSVAGEPGDTLADLRRERQAPRPAEQAGTAWIERTSADTPAPRPGTESKIDGGSGSNQVAASFSGRNKVWIPALGIRRSVSSFACSSNAYPGNRVYRWGCAGSNNIYLFGHAHSVFKPLHDAYVRGRLQKGMKVHYADGNGRISTYKVSWWKVTTPDKGGFAYAAQSRPSMTLQTCVGARSQYRLIVRLVRAA
jgi:Sortase domain